jgi:hypothetical protein
MQHELAQGEREVRGRWAAGGLLAPGLRHGDAGQIGRELVGGERLDLEGDEAEERDAQVHLTVRAIHHHGHGEHLALAGADDLDGLLHATALGDDVLDDEDLLAGNDLEPTPQGEPAVLFLGEDEADAELAGDFLADNKAAHGRGNHGDSVEAADLVGEGLTEPFDGGHVLEGEGALEVLPTVEAAAQDEMAFQQRAGVAEDLQGFSARHGASFPHRLLRIQSKSLWASQPRAAFPECGVPKWVKSILALLLLPLCYGATQALVLLLRQSGGEEATLVWVPLVAGVACWIVIYVLLPRPMWLYVVGHELTHVIWTWAFWGKVKKFKAGAGGGHVVVTRVNFLITLAPYFFPFYVALVVLGFAAGNAIWNWNPFSPFFHVLVGAAYGFHVTLTAHALQTHQTDITDQGYLFSGVIILLGNAVVLLVGLPLLTQDVSPLTALLWCWRGTGEAIQAVRGLF